jgi:hypothetical protein
LSIRFCSSVRTAAPNPDVVDVVAVPPDVASDDRDVASELARPEVVGEHHHGVAPRHFVLFGPECAT